MASRVDRSFDQLEGIIMICGKEMVFRETALENDFPSPATMDNFLFSLVYNAPYVAKTERIHKCCQTA